ncbi:TRAP transporter solute receptor, TAXI family [Desulfosarcina variabilis str. Montpellier]|uniref:TAXI family TRAP transporter solute-binding subunit n=1 Tax=Desulfosarcina variabilis TaxID=2300 RepID=UPI003AFB7EFF
MKSFTIKVVWLALIFLLPSLTLGQAAHHDPSLCIITGDANSTAYRIGQDIRALANRYDIHLTVFPSRGDIENVMAVYQRPGHHLGLVGSDVLAFVDKVENAPQLALISKKIKWIFPLYDKDVHLLASEKIKTFSDLKGCRVAIGNEQGGTYLTSRLLFEIADVKPLELIAIGGGRALAALRDGRIDAMITVDGAPVDWLTGWVAAGDGLHLVPITEARIREFYPSSRIPSETYPWQAAAVHTVSVKTVLVAYDFRNQYCHWIGRLAWLIRENLAWFKQHGHLKWKTVNINQSMKGWKPYECVLDYTPSADDERDHQEPQRVSNPIVNAIQAVFQP